MEEYNVCIYMLEKLIEARREHTLGEHYYIDDEAEEIVLKYLQGELRKSDVVTAIVLASGGEYGSNSMVNSLVVRAVRQMLAKGKLKT